jgi:hypothetical protein
MDPSGVVQTKPRVGSIATQFDALQVRGAPGIYEIGTETPSDWLPGNTFTGPTVSATISRTMIDISAERLRVEVMVA